MFLLLVSLSFFSTQANATLLNAQRLSLVDTRTGSLTLLSNGIYIGTSSGQGLSVDANIDPHGWSITQVIFTVDGSYSYSATSAPWALCGHKGSSYAACPVLTAGSHTVTATPYSGTTRGGAMTVQFNLQAPLPPLTIQPLVTNAMIDALRAGSSSVWSGIQWHCDSSDSVNYVPSPVANFSPGAAYNSVGANETPAEVNALSNDGLTAYRDALCYRLTGNIKYATRAEAILNAWANTLKVIGNQQGAYDFVFNFPEYVLAAGFLKSDHSWNSGPFIALLKNVVLPASNTVAYKPNNIGLWTSALWATSAAYLKDQSLLNQALVLWNTRLSQGVASDGTMTYEVCRSITSDSCGGPTMGKQGIYYTNWALYAATIAAETFYHSGVNVYTTPTGRQMLLAYHNVAGWVVDPTTFPYYASNNGSLNGVEKYGFWYVLQQRSYSNWASGILAQSGIIHLDQQSFEVTYATSVN